MTTQPDREAPVKETEKVMWTLLIIHNKKGCLHTLLYLTAHTPMYLYYDHGPSVTTYRRMLEIPCILLEICSHLDINNILLLIHDRHMHML
jgi:hypothetical protein